MYTYGGFYFVLMYSNAPPSKSEPTVKVYFIWVPEVGTSRGHEPITDQSCGAVIFFP